MLDACLIFDEFDKKASSKPINILQKGTNTNSFRDTKKQILLSENKTLQDIAAMTIQAQWRKYKTHMKFRHFISVFKKLRLLRLHPVFNVLLLNSHVGAESREKHYDLIKQDNLVFRKFNLTTKKSSFAFFSLTDIMFLPLTANEKKYTILYKAVSKPLLKDIFLNWRITARRMRKTKNVTNYSRLCSLNMGSFFSAFEMWHKYTLNKRGKTNSFEFPQWSGYLKSSLTAANIVKKADNKFIQTLRQRAISALIENVKTKNSILQSYKDADAYRNRMALKRGSIAWSKYILKKKESETLKRTTLLNWFSLIQAKKHNMMLTNAFNERSIMLKKRYAFGAFLKNLKIQKVLRFNSTIKISNEVSLALWFAYALMKNDDNRALACSIYAWKKYTKGRKMWTHFMFNDIKSSEYMPLKRKVLDIFLKKKVQKVTSDIRVFNSKPFLVESMTMYESVMTATDDRKDFFLLLDDPSVAGDISNANTAVKQRNVFSLCWLSLPTSNTIFKRVAMLVTQHEKQIRAVREPNEALKDTYAASMNTLAMFGFMSDIKLNTINRIFAENAKRMMRNRAISQMRDRCIVLANSAHESAKQFSNAASNFTIDEVRPQTAKSINELSEEVIGKHVDIIPISSIEPGENDEDFAICRGITRPIPSFSAQLKELRKKIRDDLKRTNCEGENRRLKMMMENQTTEMHKFAGNASITSETFGKSEKKYTKRPATGINDRLLQAFPANRRKPNANLCSMKQTQISEEKNEEEEDEADKNEMIKLTEMSNGSTMKKLLDEARYKQSTTFGNSVIGFLKKSTAMMNFKSSIEGSSTLDKIEEDASPAIPEEDQKQDNYEEYEEEELDQASSKSSPAKRKEITTFSSFNLPSISQANDPEDYTKTKKYQDFLNILFGKTISVPAAKLNAIRKKILDEANYRNETHSIPGINLSGTARLISNAAEKYREDKNAVVKRREERNQKDFVGETESESKARKGKAKEYEDEKNSTGLEYQIKYNSRKFAKKKKQKTITIGSVSFDTEHDNDAGDDSDSYSENGTGNGDRTINEMNATHEDLLQQTIDDEAGFDNPNEKISDDEFDAADPLHGKTKEEIEEIKRLRGEDDEEKIKLLEKMPEYYKQQDMSKTMVSVNKVVFKILEDNISFSSNDEGFSFVDVDPDSSIPSLRLPKSGRSDKLPQEQKTELPQLKKDESLPSRSSLGVPIVIPSMKVIDKTMATIIEESDNYPTLTYAEGNTTFQKAKHPIRRSNVPQIFKPIFKMSDPSSMTGLHFEDESKVVSFAGGSGRPLTGMKGNYTNIRILNTKRKCLTRPISTSMSHTKRVTFIKPTSNVDSLKKKVEQFVLSFSNFADRSDFGVINRAVGQLNKNQKPIANTDSVSEQLGSIVNEVPVTKLATTKSLFDFSMAMANDNATLLSECITRLNVQLNTKKILPLDAGKAIIKLFRVVPQYIYILQNCMKNEAEKRKTTKPKKAEENQPKKEEKTKKSNTKKRPTYANIGWVNRAKINCVELQFGDNKNLDAIIAPTKDESTKQNDRNRRQVDGLSVTSFNDQLTQAEQWDEVLSNYDLDDLVTIARYVVSEKEIDDIFQV